MDGQIQSLNPVVGVINASMQVSGQLRNAALTGSVSKLSNVQGDLSQATPLTGQTFQTLFNISDADLELYDESTYEEQLDDTYLYFAFDRLDGTGYLAKRLKLDDASAAGTFFGSLPRPADLTLLSYA